MLVGVDLPEGCRALTRGFTMRYFKYLALLAVLAFAIPAATAHAQVAVGIGVGGPAYADGYEYAGPPVCDYGYYNYYPYACAPYGYYGPAWFSGGLFIGAGPWFRGGYGYGGYRGGYGFRGGYGYRGGYGGGYRGGYGGFHGGYGGVHPGYGAARMDSPVVVASTAVPWAADSVAAAWEDFTVVEGSTEAAEVDSTAEGAVGSTEADTAKLSDYQISRNKRLPEDSGSRSIFITDGGMRLGLVSVQMLVPLPGALNDLIEFKELRCPAEFADDLC